MPYTIKTTFYFAGQRQGWSESFYWTKSNNNLAEAETLVTPLAQKRALLLADTYSLTIGRNAVVKGLGGEKIKRVVDVFEPGYTGTASWKPAAPGYSLLCRWQNASNTQNKPQYMRGIPAGLGDNGKIPDLGFGTWLSLFNSWRSAMIAFAAGWNVTAVSQTATIANYVQSPTSGTVTFTLAGAGLTWPVTPGRQTTAYVKLPDRNPMDGALLVIPVSDTTCYTARPYGVQPFPTGAIGLMELRTASLVTLAADPGGTVTGQIHPQRIVTHKTGNPSYASRGRSATKVHW